MNGYLRVRVGRSWYGLGVQQVLEVLDEFEIFPAPGVHPAVLGTMSIRRRMVPVVRLGSLITEGRVGEDQGEAAILARCRGSLIAFEVDDAEELVLDEPLPVPDAWQLPWAAGVVKHEGDLIPVIDLEILTERLAGDRSEIGGERGR